MSEELFELHIDNISVDIDTHAIASQLSPLLNVGIQQLEKQLVKVKLLHGRSESLKSGLTKEQAADLQKLLKSMSLVTSIKAEWALMPMEKIVIKDEFTCPACHFQQHIEVEKKKICSECGVVKEKYELAEKRKALELQHLKQARLIQQGARDKDFMSVEQRNEAFLKKKRQSLLPKKKRDMNMLFPVLLLVVSAVSAAGYMFMGESSTESEDDKALQVTQNTLTEQQSLNSPASSPSNPSTSSTKPVNNGDEMVNELGNPYSKVVNGSTLPPIAMEDAPQYVDKLLNKNKSSLPPVDKAALGDISTLYKEVDETQEAIPDFKQIKKIANSVSDKGVRDKLMKQASWQEVESGVKSFDDFGIYAMQRAGEDNNIIALVYEDIELYMTDYRYDKAASVASQIKGDYLQAVALNKIMDSQFYLDLKGAEKQRDNIELISKNYGLTEIQKPLILGLLYQADRRLGNNAAADITFKKLLLAIDDITDDKEKVATLVQLGEDQREGLNFTDAQYFLQLAEQQLAQIQVKVEDEDRFYGLLSQSYARLFEFGRANTLLAKIKNTQEKNRLAQVVTLIEKKATL